MNRKLQRLGGSDRVLSAFFYAFVFLFSLACLYPLLLALSSSFTEETIIVQKGFSLLPRGFSLTTFQFMLAKRGLMVLSAYRISIIVVVLGTVLAVMVSAMYAYVLSVPGFKHANKFAFFAYFTMLFSGGMLPWYILCTRYYHLNNTLQGLILPYGMNVFNMFLLRNYIRTIPSSILESARIDGAGNTKIFFRIVFPLSQVGLVTVALFYSLGFWNDFYLPLMLITKDSLTTIQYMLYRVMGNIEFLATNPGNSNLAQYVQPPMYTSRMAISVLAIGPIFLVYPFVQKYFVRGVVLGAVKG